MPGIGQIYYGLLGVWGGFKRRIHGILLCWFISNFFCVALYGLGQSTAFWIVTGVTGIFFMPIVRGSNTAIWQSKVSPEVQGKVFATNKFFAALLMPITPVIAGIIADNYLEPFMKTPGTFSTIFSPLVGTSPGSGMGLIIFLCGLCASILPLGGYLSPLIRKAEDLLPDWNEKKP